MSRVPEVRGRPRSRNARIALLALGALLVSPLLLLNVSADGGRFVNDTWLTALVCVLPGLTSAACFARAESSSADRLAWRLIGAGLGFWAAGAIGRFLLLDVSDGRPVPAWVDPLFLAMYPLVFLGLILVLRGRLRAYRHLAIYDSLAGFILLVAVCFTFFPDPITELTGYDELGTAVLVSYPLGDIGILILTGCLFRFTANVREGPWLAFGAGMTLFALADLYFAFETPTGGATFGLLNVFWLTGFLLMIHGSWQPDGEVIEVSPGVIQVTVPLVYLAIVIGALLYGQGRDLWDSTVISLSVVALLVLLRLTVTANEYSVVTRRSEVRAVDRNTGLPSRRRFDGWLGGLALIPAGSQSPLFVQVIVIDRLAELEAALGPASLDTVISIAATRIKRSVGELGRLATTDRGEFALLCSEESAPEPETVANRISRSLDQPVEVGGIKLRIEAVIGCARTPEDTNDPNELLRLALISCHEAREEDERLRLSPRDPDRTRKSLERAEELREAIATGQLRLFYQPKVRTEDGTVGSVEALVRWEHPRDGLLGPAEFVPLAERSGLTPDLTDVVADLAMAQVRNWRDRGVDLGVAINLGMSDLLDQELVDRLAAARERHAVETRDVTLEVSEDLVMKRPELLLSNLRGLRDAGYRVSLDDFGSGTTSLGYLRSLPLDEVKIDRSLIVKMHESPADSVVCEAAVAMINGLEMDVVAEGAEEPSTIDRLTGIRCREIQSYHFGRPMPATEIETWLRENHPAR